MAVTVYAYYNFKFNAYKKLISDLSSGATDLRLMLCTSEYVPNLTTHTCKSDITNEIVEAGYTAGGKQLTSVTFTLTGNVFTLDAANVAWAAATFDVDLPRYAVLYDNTIAGDANKKLILYIDFGTSRAIDGATFTVKFHASGILNG